MSAAESGSHCGDNAARTGSVRPPAGDQDRSAALMIVVRSAVLEAQRVRNGLATECPAGVMG
jgi:hypothetical protein